MPKQAIVKKAVHAKHKMESNTGSSGSSLSGAALKILNVIAHTSATMRVDEVCRKQVQHLSGIKGKSTIANALTKLKNDGLVVVTPGMLSLTPMGKEAADPIEESDIPANNAEFQAMKTRELPERALQLFEAVADGRDHRKKDVASAIGLKMNSTFANLLTKLKKDGIIEFDRENVRLAQSMFPFEPRPEF